MKELEADDPLFLMAAMLARQFIEAPFQATVESKVIAAERQHLARYSCAIEPF